MLARYRRARHSERRPILKLIPKAKGAARLVEGRSRPHATDERLVEKPAVDEDVHGPIRRLDLNRAEDVVPIPRHGRQHSVEVGGSVARNEGLRFYLRACLAETENDLRRGFRLKLNISL